MKANQKKIQDQQTNKITIVKNKEIIIYQNGEEYKRFKQSETKELNEDELYILDFLLKKYSLYEVPPKSSKLNENDFIFESTDDIFKKRQGKSQTQFLEEDEDRRTEPKLKEFFNDIEDENEEDLEDIGREEITETKKMKKEKITTEDVKVPIQKKIKNSNYQYEEENADIEEENQEEEESEENPQYIIEAESYTSPTIRYIDEKKAEDELLNGIQTYLMINGQDKKGILFLGGNETIIFVSFEDKKETIISLNNIKRIYFNIKGSSNLRNYNKKTNNERFIQLVELNNRKTDFKFNNDTELEYFIKGLIKSYKNKTPPIDKSIIYEKNSKYFIKTTEKKDQKGKYTFANKSNKYITDKNGKKEKHSKSHYRRRNVISNEDNCNEKKYESNNYNYKKIYNKKKYYDTDENKDNYINNINNENNNEEKEGDYNENYEENYNEFNEENNNENYENGNNEENNENYNENYNGKYNENYNENYENNKENNEEYFEEYNGNNENYVNYQNNGNNNDDDFVTTTKIEVYKDGKLINEETQEEYGGVVRTVHSYRPDIGEYEEFLRKSSIKKSNVSDDDINGSLKRVKDLNKFQ